MMVFIVQNVCTFTSHSEECESVFVMVLIIYLAVDLLSETFKGCRKNGERKRETSTNM